MVNFNLFVDNIKYNIKHRNEVIRVEKQYKGYNTFLCRIHDLDKLIMMCLFIPDRAVSKIHRIFSWHHVNNKIGWFNLDEAIFDWESARFTKPDKPLTARETCLKYYPQLKDIVFHRCDQLGIK